MQEGVFDVYWWWGVNGFDWRDWLVYGVREIRRVIFVVSKRFEVRGWLGLA